jgi:6-phosphogluconolactonase (cycloisomerase 2 family)
VIDPVGQNLYTAVNADESLYCLTLSAAGIGTFDPNNYAYCAGAGNGPTSVAINPAGTYVYAGNGNADGALSSFQVQSGSLNPTSIGGGNGFIMASATGTNVTGVAVDPTGRFLAAAINDTDEVGLYTLDSGGNITPAGNTVVVAAGAGPTQVIFHPTLKALYASNQGTNTISAFSFTASGLTQLTGPGLAIPASDSGPGALAIR